MPLPSDVLAIEASQIGVAETPDGSNVTPYSQWIGVIGAWCCSFQSWALVQAGLPIGPTSKGAAWCSSLYEWYRSQGRAWVGVEGIRAGDLIFFEWGSTAGGYDHIGIVERVNGDVTVTTIEGNVGNRVQRLTRSLATGGIHSHARPHYTTPPPEDPDMAFGPDEAALLQKIADESAAVHNAVFAPNGITDRVTRIERDTRLGLRRFWDKSSRRDDDPRKTPVDRINGLVKLVKLCVPTPNAARAAQVDAGDIDD